MDLPGGTELGAAAAAEAAAEYRSQHTRNPSEISIESPPPTTGHSNVVYLKV